MEPSIFVGVGRWRQIWKRRMFLFWSTFVLLYLGVLSEGVEHPRGNQSQTLESKERLPRKARTVATELSRTLQALPEQVLFPGASVAPPANSGSWQQFVPSAVRTAVYPTDGGIETADFSSWQQNAPPAPLGLQGQNRLPVQYPRTGFSWQQFIPPVVRTAVFPNAANTPTAQDSGWQRSVPSTPVDLQAQNQLPRQRGQTDPSWQQFVPRAGRTVSTDGTPSDTRRLATPPLDEVRYPRTARSTGDHYEGERQLRRRLQLLPVDPNALFSQVQQELLRQQQLQPQLSRALPFAQLQQRGALPLSPPVSMPYPQAQQLPGMPQELLQRMQQQAQQLQSQVNQELQQKLRPQLNQLYTWRTPNGGIAYGRFGSATASASSSSYTSAQNIQQVPQNIQQVPQNIQQVPQNIQQVPQNIQQVPQNIQQVPQNIQQVPQNIQQVPQNIQQVPQNIQQVPQNIQQVPQNIQQVPQGIQQVPQGIQQVPQGIQQVPQASQQWQSSQETTLPPQAPLYGNENAPLDIDALMKDLQTGQSNSGNKPTEGSGSDAGLPELLRPELLTDFPTAGGRSLQQRARRLRWMTGEVEQALGGQHQNRVRGALGQATAGVPGRALQPGFRWSQFVPMWTQFVPSAPVGWRPEVGGPPLPHPVQTAPDQQTARGNPAVLHVPEPGQRVENLPAFQPGLHQGAAGDPAPESPAAIATNLYESHLGVGKLQRLHRDQLDRLQEAQSLHRQQLNLQFAEQLEELHGLQRKQQKELHQRHQEQLYGQTDQGVLRQEREKLNAWHLLQLKDLQDRQEALLTRLQLDQMEQLKQLLFSQQVQLEQVQQLEALDKSDHGQETEAAEQLEKLIGRSPGDASAQKEAPAEGDRGQENEGEDAADIRGDEEQPDGEPREEEDQEVPPKEGEGAIETESQSGKLDTPETIPAHTLHPHRSENDDEVTRDHGTGAHENALRGEASDVAKKSEGHHPGRSDSTGKTEEEAAKGGEESSGNELVPDILSEEPERY